MAQPERDEAQPAVVEEVEPSGEGEQAPSSQPPPEQPPRRREPAPEIAALQEGPEPEGPGVEEAPAMEHEAIRPPEAGAPGEAQPAPGEAQPAPGEEEIASGPSPEERRAIADQPTELYDVEGEEFAPSASPAPSEDELVEEGINEPRLAPVDPLAGVEKADESEAAAPLSEEDEEEDDFFDEKRLSDELDQALEAPMDTGQEDAESEGEAEPQEAVALEEPLPTVLEEDLLEETPDFLEGTPEDDELWFEQQPPKDFDFDD
jgi:hypothetical protein